jgi:hypothetical protein
MIKPTVVPLVLMVIPLVRVVDIRVVAAISRLISRQ